MKLALAPVVIEDVEYKVEHAVVDTYELQYEDHGFFTVLLSFKGDGWGQGLPGRALCTYDRELDRRVGTAFGCDFLMECVSRLGSPGTALQPVVVLRRGHFIEGFARLHADGSVGEPFLPEQLAARHFPEAVAG